MIMRDNNDFEAPKPIAEVLIHWNRALGICLEFVFGEISKKKTYFSISLILLKKVYTKYFGFKNTK